MRLVMATSPSFTFFASRHRPTAQTCPNKQFNHQKVHSTSKSKLPHHVPTENASMDGREPSLETDTSKANTKNVAYSNALFQVSRHLASQASHGLHFDASSSLFWFRSFIFHHPALAPELFQRAKLMNRNVSIFLVVWIVWLYACTRNREKTQKIHAEYHRVLYQHKPTIDCKLAGLRVLENQ